MNLNDLAALSRLLDSALDLGVDQREAWLESLPLSERHLAPTLREMLAAHDGQAMSGFLTSLPVLSAESARAGMAATEGDLVGPYRLLRELGRGGMGEVWLAERADGSLRRQVALKLPRLAWGAGLAERMQRERDIGALLEHPHIARLYDAGLDECGRPYLAFEYIDGHPIDAWCDKRKLPVRDRLCLVVQVTQAVAYAHGRLVVHRDLKPSNVLVTEDGRAHLLDFGIAKLLSEGVLAESGLTQEQGRVLTPRYASPEQLRGEAITVQSDVYSLGVLAYGLLTGTMPHSPKRSTLAAIEEAVLEDEPAPASSRVDKATARMLRGEVDAILAMALRRDPTRRYATADALADDIERHLAGDRVLAQPDSAWYRFSKTLKRYRAGFAAGAAVMLAVLTGATIAIVQARRANEEAARVKIVKDFVVDVFKVNARDDPAKSELRQLPVEMLLERGARLIDTKFAGQSRLQAELFGVVAEIFANMSSATLAEDYATKQIGALDASAVAGNERAAALLLLARAQMNQGSREAAESSARQALSIRELDDATRNRLNLLLAKVLLSRLEYDASDQHLREVEAAVSSNPVPDVAVRAAARTQRALWLTRRNRADEAFVLFEAAVGDAVAVHGAMSRDVAEVRLEYFRELVGHDRGAEASKQWHQGLEALRSVGGDDDIAAAIAQAEGARLLADWYVMPFEEAVSNIKQARQILASRANVPRSIVAICDFYLGSVLWHRGWIEQGFALISAAAPLLQGSGDETTEMYRDITRNLAMVSIYLKDEHDRAETLLSQALQRSIHRSDAYGHSQSLIYLGLFFRVLGRYDEAERLLVSTSQLRLPPGQAQFQAKLDERRVEQRAYVALNRGDPSRALELLPAEDRLDPSRDGNEHRLIRGEALCALGRHAQGLKWLESYLEAMGPVWSDIDPDLARTRAVAGMCALAAGDRARAVELGDLARSAFERQPRIASYWKAPSERLDRSLRR